ncbi:uncharacterized protein LOC115420940 isoform X2 [Sphaeramia orbicularis]|nr:uncharacterized protein LOC115420940 isoform X2 [Sphaeramia orbicularis]XP_029992430.1 uncharacterized protein LOC115420940 isoform X2 [Sphaeramia orbicularis]
MVFMDETHRLLPRLVTPIKHMKIMFGLKTLVVMWMLREGRGLTDVIHKILQFFPNKLPQYEGHCSKREMFLMRKNQLDFKALAQTLTIDKQKLQEYMKSQMEEEYGEPYAQKVEDRLVEYLHELDKALPTDTYIDKILKKDHPVNEEEKLLLDVIGSDSTTIGTTLKRLLHCDAASCCSHKPANEAESDLSKLTDSLQPVENKLHLGSQPQVIREEQAQLLPKETHLISESRRNVQTQEVLETEKDGGRPPTLGNEHDEEEGHESDRGEDLGGTSPGPVDSPQFCSKHQRWVKNILRQCPDECSEELLVQSVVSTSPPLFQSSNSTSSSEDLTPSDLPFSSHQQHRSPQTSNNPPTNAQDKPDCEPAQSSSSGHLPLPPLWSPVVRLIDITSVRRLHPLLNPNPASPDGTSPAGLKAITSPRRQSKRWARNILRQCPDECSEDLLVQSVVSTSPLLFQSSNSMSSSEDLTPSDLLFSPHQQQRSPQTSNNPPTNAQDKPDCGPALSSSSGHLLLPPLWSPVVRLIDITTIRRLHPFLNPNPASPDEASPAGLKAITSPRRQSNPIISTQTGPERQNPASSSRCPSTNLSRRSRLMSNTNQSQRPRPSAETLGNVHTSALTTSEPLDGLFMESPTSVEPHSMSLLTVLPMSRSGLVFRSGPSGVCRVQTRLSLKSQNYLVHSKLLQPQVILTRLSVDQCLQRTGGRTWTRPEETVEGDDHDDGDDGDDGDTLSSHLFDVNILYSSDSSGSDSEDSEDSDPNYKPNIKRSKCVFHIDTW